ncbi:MAG: nitrous oxide reductase family maturation protein NosD [Candidatus Sifarchaeia archaeon]
MGRRILICVPFLVLVITFSLGNGAIYHGVLESVVALNFGYQMTPADSYTPHGAITIHNDAAFSYLGWPGKGIPEDPFVIEGLRITTAVEECITITDTTVYFEIRNCQITVEFGGSTYDGILFENIVHGTVRNCIIDMRGPGISLENSSNCIFMDNTVNDNYVGIRLMESNNCTLTRNTVCNSYQGGIYLTKSNNCILIDNTLTSNYGGLNLQESNNCTLEQNIVTSDTATGFYISDSTNCTLALCTASGNSNSGFTLPYSSNCYLTNNSAYENKFDGFTLHGSTNCTLIHNNATSNSYYGVRLYPESEDNTIFLNRLGSNGEGTARDDGNSNVWDDGVSLGNYWKDYDGTGWYHVLGSAHSIDHYPFTWNPMTNTDNTIDGDADTMLFIALSGLGIATLTIGVVFFWRKRGVQ